jgi:hypothetical protein
MATRPVIPSIKVRWTRFLKFVAFAIALGAFFIHHSSHEPRNLSSIELRHAPLTFEANRGQEDASVDYVAHGRGYSLSTTRQGATIVLKNPSKSKADTLRLRLIDANPDSAPRGTDEQPGRTSYFIGKDPSKWRTNIPNFGRVTYPSVYDGIDMVYYGNQENIEYDFAISPGADPRKIALAIEGDVQSIDNDGAGNLNIQTSSGAVQLRRPRTYQKLASGTREIPTSYSIEKSVVRLEVGEYDKERPLIVDPVLVYSTYFGGAGNDLATSVATDTFGNVYIVGGGVFDSPPMSVFGTTGGAFLAVFNPAGTTLLYSAYISGSEATTATAVAVDAFGNAYITGYTYSTDFPTSANAVQSFNAGTYDAFMSIIAVPTQQLTYSTYLGGSGDDYGNSIATDGAGGVVIAGQTYSTDFPQVNPFQQKLPGATAGFVTKINPKGAGFVYSTYLGGGFDDAVNSVAMDASGKAYVVGITTSTKLPTVNALQASEQGISDAFITKLNADGKSAAYSTYLGGSGFESGTGVAIDSAGNAYVTGLTYSGDFPTVRPSHAYSGGIDSFIAKIAPDGASLSYSTYIGASNVQSSGIAVDASGSAYITGLAFTSDLPLINPLQSVLSGSVDAFMVKLSPAGSAFLFSTYLGGSNADSGEGIAIDPSGYAYIAGRTYSSNFPAVNAFQSSTAGLPAAFLAKIDTNTSNVAKKRAGQITSQ